MKKLIHISIVLLLLLFSCKKDKSVDNIDSDIKIKMWETVDSTKRTLQFSCWTDNSYPCCNYGIINNFSQSSDKIDIDFSGISVPDLCLTSIGPATATIDFGSLSIGTYDLEIKVEKSKSSGQLIVASDYYSITFDKQKRLQIINSPLYRIPSNTIWGYVGFHSISTETLVQTYIDSLQLLGASQQTYQPGDYGYFQINSSGQILPQSYGYYFSRDYIFNYSTNTNSLKKLVNNYGTNYGDSLSIILYTTKGEIFRSWIH